MYWYIIYATCPKEDTRNRRNRGNEETRRRRNEETKKRIPEAEAIGGKINAEWRLFLLRRPSTWISSNFFVLIPHGAEVFSSFPRFATILYVQYFFLMFLIFSFWYPPNIFFDPLNIFFWCVTLRMETSARWLATLLCRSWTVGVLPKPWKISWNESHWWYLLAT